MGFDSFDNVHCSLHGIYSVSHGCVFVRRNKTERRKNAKSDFAAEQFDIKLKRRKLDKKIYDLLSYLKNVCKGKYYLFSRKELAEKCGNGTVTEEELNAYIDSLITSGYIDRKYSDKDVMLLKPLGKSLTAEFNEKPQAEIGFRSKSEEHNAFFKFFIAFLGGFSGALAGIAVFAALC